MVPRPLALMGSERSLMMESGMPDESEFDGRSGVWRDKEGRLAIHGVRAPSTYNTKTREGIDQSEHMLISTITRTQEGLDQVESANAHW